MNTEDAGKSLTSALFKVSCEITSVAKSGTNSHFKNKYATLESVQDTLRPVLQANGIFYIHKLGEVVDGAMRLTLIVTHDPSGGCDETVSYWPLARPSDPQCIASTTTYARRITLVSYFGLTTTDDDGEGGVPERAPPKQAYQQKAKPQLVPQRGSKELEFEAYVRNTIRDGASQERLKALAEEITENSAVMSDAWLSRALLKVNQAITAQAIAAGK